LGRKDLENVTPLRYIAGIYSIFIQIFVVNSEKAFVLNHSAII